MWKQLLNKIEGYLSGGMMFDRRNLFPLKHTPNPPLIELLTHHRY